MNRLTIGALLAAVSVWSQVAVADYFATRVDFVTFSGTVFRLDEATGNPVPGFSFELPPESGGVFAPSGIVAGPDDFLYTADNAIGFVYRVNPVSGETTTFGMLPPIAIEPEFLPGQAGGLQFLPSGNLIVTGRADDTLYELDGTTGAIVGTTVLPPGTTPTGVALDADGSLLVAGFDAGAVLRVDGNSTTDAAASLITPLGVEPTGDGRFWVTDAFGNTLHLFNADGSPAREAIVVPPMIPDELPPGVSPTNAPAGVSIDDEGNLLLATIGLFGDNGFLYRIERIAGDFNGDLAVNQDDYDLWRANFGEAPTSGQYDGNGDGIFDAADYTVWRDTLGSPPQLATIVQGGGGYTDIIQFAPVSPQGSLAVPEPSALALAVVAVTAILRRRLR